MTDTNKPSVWCTVCKGTNVQIHDWVDPNTNTVVGGFDSTWESMARHGESWCSDCGEHTVLASVESAQWDLGATVEIHDHKEADDSKRTYTADCADDCRDAVVREAYRLAVELNDTVSLGSVIATPKGP